MKKSSNTNIPGVRKKAPGKFILDFRDHNGRRRQKLFHGNKVDAVRARMAILARRDRIRAGIEAPPEKTQAKPTLQEVWDMFTKHRQQKVDGGSMKQNSLDRYKWIKKSLNKYSPKLLKTSIDQISSEMIDKFKRYRLKKGFRKEGINTELRHIRAVFNFGKIQGFINISPMRDVSNIKVTKKDVRFLSDEELVILKKALGELDLSDKFEKDAHDLMVFYLFTGARVSEALLPNFTWSCITSKAIVFPVTKNNTSRTISKMKPIDVVLKSRRNLPTGPFQFTYDQVYNRILYVFNKAKLENASPHTLRKTAGAWYYMATRDIFAVKCWLGHSNVTVTENHYTGLIQSLRESDDDAFEQLLTKQLESKPDKTVAL